MFFDSALFSTLLLAFAVLASPTSSYDQPQLVERSLAQSHPTQTTPQVAGAGFKTATKGSVKAMSIQLTIPYITGGDVTSGVIGALIDGVAQGNDGCFPILCGVQMIRDEGKSYYQAVWQVNSGYFYEIDPSAEISAGDRIEVAVEVNENQSAVFTVVNLKNPQHPWRYYYTLPAPPCMESGFWVVHTVEGLSLPNFGTVDMLVHANVAGSPVNAQNAYIFDLQSGQASAFISSDGSIVSVAINA